MKSLASATAVSRGRMGRSIGVVALSSVLLVAAAFAATIWRYEHSQRLGRSALAEHADRLRVEQAAKIFWHEREAINEYLITKEPAVLREIEHLRVEFLRLTEGLDRGKKVEARLVTLARTANGRLLLEFEMSRGIGQKDTGANLRAIEALHPFEEAVLRPLRILNASGVRTGQARSSAASAASGQARVVAVLGAILALGAGLGFAAYAALLVRHVARQAGQLERTLAEREQAHAALHDRDRELRQTQKMEAVGRLAAGVAHDFNNILLAVTGYSDLALTEVEAEQHGLRSYIEQVKAAATRAATLTKQLLAFGRQQVAQPQVVDVGALLEDLTAMLRPLLGKTVELVLELEPLGASTEVDPGQLDQVVTNLVLNARDAMPNGGRVTITLATDDLIGGTNGSSRLPPGRYVRLTVADTGTGMDEETLARAFDPFFTTKELGKGTGLGLATVHGIITQSGGDIEIASAHGEGTTFTIHLPHAEAGPAEPARQSGPKAEPGSETILLVEDDNVARSLLCEILEHYGYDVVTADSGTEAIDLMTDLNRQVHLLITDIVMPGLSGRDLSDHLKTINPELRAIYMSGYTQDARLYREAEAGQIDFLQKPFSPTTLAETARKVLDRPTDAAPETALAGTPS
jgi:signal transduction histidine kinase/ActR/RegA family two-component response regulator